jgi:hypothetical protein
MTKVFIGGSRRIPRLPAEVRARLDRIVTQGFPVVVGDASGADTAVQQYLHSKGYQDVEVFCSGDEFRNNVGGWPVRHVEVAGRKRDRKFYAAKDRVMTDEATVGFMLWDGKSLGTLQNVARLLAQGKTSLVYVAPTGAFREIRAVEDWRELLAGCPADVRHRAEQEEAAVEAHVHQPAQPSLL